MSRRREKLARQVLSFVAGAVMVLGLGLPVVSAFAQSPQPAKVMEFDIPAQPLETALQQVAEKAKLQLLYSPGDVKGVATRGLKGSYTTKEAIDRLIDGTGLTASVSSQNAVAIKPKGEDRKPGVSGGTSTSGPTILAQAAARPNDPPEQEASEAPKKGEKIEVTGSRLTRAASEGPNDVRVYPSEQIERSGQSTLASFLNTLPEISYNSVESSFTATTVRLRGLPEGSVLVLINGRRVQNTSGSAGPFGFFDLNLIPLAAIERIEILPFGSSAVYGGDALADVINLILKIACAGRECRGDSISGVEWTSDGKLVVFADQVDGQTRLHAWEPKANAVRTILSTSELLGGGVGVARQKPRACPFAGKVALCTTSSGAAPPRLEALDLETGDRRVLLDPNGDLRRRVENSVQVEYLSWNDKWGQTNTGVLVVPRHIESTVKLPLVITSYQCPGFLRGGVGATVSEHLLAARGMAALCVNRAVPSSPLAPSYKLTGQHRNLQALLDSWEASLDYLAKRGRFDLARVGVSGLSLSSEGVLYAIGHSHRFAAAASSSLGSTDTMNYYYRLTTGALGRYLNGIYGMPNPAGDAQNVYDNISPARNAKSIKAPLLTQASESEFRKGVEFYASMLLHKRPMELVLFPDEGHNIMQPRHRLIHNERNVDWFQFWLRGEEDPDPAKITQYERWRRLKAVQH